MTNIGRNQPCPCGSGKKYKKCHGAYTVKESPLNFPDSQAALAQGIKEVEARHARREKQQGLGRPIIAAKLRDHQMVAVGKRVHFSDKWHTFHDFLRDHLFGLLGKEWGAAELAKPLEERHRILRWFDQATEDARRTGTKTGEVYTAPMSGAVRAFINLAYNVYLIAHHTEKDGDAIVKRYIDRLKSTRSDDFAGALFETYAAAAFLKAGFKLAFENERDGSASHVEFVALYPKTGKRFSVEVKARERGTVDPGADDVDDVKRLRVANKLNKALGKKAAHTRVVMIEINVPDVVTTYRRLARRGVGTDTLQRKERLSERRKEAERLRVRYQPRLSQQSRGDGRRHAVARGGISHSRFRTRRDRIRATRAFSNRAPAMARCSPS